MAIRGYEPFSVLNELSRELGRFQEGQEASDGSSLATAEWVPAVDIREEQDHYVIEADLPGVSPEAIDVQMERGELTVRGERAGPSRDQAPSYRRAERAVGTFYRRFSLPDTADPDGIKARTNNGVLRLDIPKKAETQPRRIKVEG
jgi:HSP20 family protein